MKDITQDWYNSLTDEDKNKNRTFVLFGEKKEVPEKVFNKMLTLYKFYEMKNLQEVIDNYPSLIRKERLSISTMIWLVGLLGKIAKRMKMMNDYVKFDKEFGSIQRELYGSVSSVKEIMLRNMMVPSQLLLFDVKFENFKQIKNMLFSAYRFDIVDIHGTKIEGVYVYEEYFNQAFSPKENIVIERRSTIELVRTSDPAKTWMAYALPLTEQYSDVDFSKKTRTKRLMVRHIQDGGSSIKPDIPLLRIR